MSYRNPQIIVDRSAEIYAQAASQIGQIWAQGVQNYFDNKKKEQNDIDKSKKAYQLGINKTELKYDDSLREALKDVDDESLYELIQAQGEGFLNGSDGQIGVIEMDTQLSLNSDLTKEQRKEYRTKIDDYKRWENRIVNLSGEVMADLEPLDNLSSSEIGVPGKIEFLGEGNEKFKNYVSAYALKRKAVPGVKTKKTADGDLLNIDISVDTKDPIIKEFINSGALQINENDISEDGKVNLRWSRDIKTWDGRFLVDIAEGPDIMKSLETANLVDNGNITKAFMSGTDYNVEDIKGTDYQKITPKNYFDPSIITENETVQAEFEAYAYGEIVSQSIDEAIVSLRSNFGAKISRQDWAGMNAEQREDFVVDLLNDKAVEEAKGSKLATKTELYDRRNNKVVSSSQLKSLAKKANMSEQDYIKQNLEIKYYTLGKSFERKKSTTDDKDVKEAVDISYIEDLKIPVQEGPALASGQRPVDLNALEEQLNKEGFRVTKSEEVGPRGVNKITITKSIAGADNQAVISEEMTPQDIKRNLELVETGKMPAKTEDEDFSLYKINQ